MSTQGFSHLDLWYNTRIAPHIENTSAVNNPNTNLTQVLDRATITFADGSEQTVGPDTFAGRCDELDDAGQVADFFIQRAMLDPGARVTPA